jgi:purine-cytosine permease-like protein
MMYKRFYWVTIPILLNAATVTGFSLVGSIVSGQTIAALDKTANISVNIGIVITCSVAFVTALFGYKVIHIWQRWHWVPNAIALIIAVGCGGKDLVQQAEVPPPTAKQIISYGSLMAGYFLTFGGTVSDFTIYHRPETPM